MNRRWLSNMSGALHYDFCPQMNAYVHWLKRPVGWLAIAFVASLLLGVFVSQQTLLASAAIAAIVVIGCLWPWLAMLGLRGKLSWEQLRVEEGESVGTQLTLTNRWPWPVWGLVVEADDAIASQVDAPNEAICLSRVAAMAESTFEWTCQPELRGVYPKKQVRLSTAFPFGLWTCYRTLEVPQELIVWPKRVKLVDVPEQSGQKHSTTGSSSPRTGHEGDWTGVRAFRPGDSLRQVHWAQTARRESLIVFERQSHSRQSVSVWLDPVSAFHCSQEQTEWLVRMVASITHQFTKHAWEVRASIDDHWTSVQASATGQQEWMDRLARWEPSHTQNTPSHLRNRQANGALFVVCTSARAQVLLDQLGHMASDIHWLVLDTRCPCCPEETLPASNLLLIDDPADPAEQFRTQWNQLCQKVMQLS